MSDILGSGRVWNSFGEHSISLDSLEALFQALGVGEEEGQPAHGLQAYVHKQLQFQKAGHVYLVLTVDLGAGSPSSNDC